MERAEMLEDGCDLPYNRNLSGDEGYEGGKL